MTLLSLFALILPAALVAPKPTKREAQRAEQWEREIELNKRFQTARLAGVKDEARRQTERLSPIEQTLTVQPISPLLPSRCPATGGFARRRGRR
jgi:hypothetical protein